MRTIGIVAYMFNHVYHVAYRFNNLQQISELLVLLPICIAMCILWLSGLIVYHRYQNYEYRYLNL